MVWKVVALIFCVCFVLVQSANTNSTVQTANGWVVGANDKMGHNYWRGIPYAQAPVGQLRWKLPQPITTNWTGIKTTTDWGASCPQTGISGPMSEDCLFLNINTPDSWYPGHALLPVMIWIHGGSFWGGSGNIYPTFLEADQMVFVSINYRLGVFGFIQLPELVNASSDKNAGFYGVQDQRAAFKWVQDNIKNFGGDPNKVTISGQSAGAISVCTHIAAPRSKGLFQRALMESGSCNQLNTVDTATAATRTGANGAGCSGATILTCMYSKTTAELIGNFTGPIWPSFNEYEQIMVQPIQLIKQGNYNKVGLLAGTNHDEQSFETCVPYGTITADQYNATLKRIFYNPLYLNVAQMYPVQYFDPPVKGVTASWTDSRFRYPTLDLLSAMSSNGQTNIYLYSMNHVRSNQKDPCYGVQHSDELNFVFPGGKAPTWNTWWTPGEVGLANSMREWWSSFVATGTPYSNTSKTTWDHYVDAQKNYMALNCTQNVSTSAMYGDFLMPYYSFWLSPTNYTGAVPNPNTPAPTTKPVTSSSGATSSGAGTSSGSGSSSAGSSSGASTSSGATSATSATTSAEEPTQSPGNSSTTALIPIASDSHAITFSYLFLIMLCIYFF